MIKKCHVVIQTAFLGDLFLSLPLLRQIKKEFPQDNLILICKSGLGDFFLAEKIVDQVLEIKKNDRESYKKVLHHVRQKSLHIQNLYCVHRSIRSQLMSLQIKARRKIGFQSFLGFFIFRDQITYQKNWPEALRQLKILISTSPNVALNLLEKDWSYLNDVDEEGQMANIPPLFEQPLIRPKTSSKKIALFPGSVWATKQWTRQGFATVAEAFFKLGYDVYLMGGPDEKLLCEDIHTLSPNSQVLAGSKSILESILFVKGCDLVISNDSAPAHMAASQNVPIVSIFGPTTLNLGFRPWTSKVIVVENKKLNCRPCGKHGHQKCPLKHHHCMIQIEAQEVIDAGLNLLKFVNP